MADLRRQDHHERGGLVNGMSKTIRRDLVLIAGLFSLIGCGGSGDKPAVPPPAAPTTAAADAGAPSGQNPALIAAGRDEYFICQTCHMENGEGVAGTYPPLAGSEIVNGPPDPMIAIVLHGLQGPVTVKGQVYNNIMAPWGSLGDDQIAAVVSYVRASFGNSASSITPQDVAAVRQATASRTDLWTIDELHRATLR